jgi:hypothetical protein
MTSKLKVYSHIDSGNAMLPRDVLEALGANRWVRQGHLYVWATTAKAAAQRLAELRLGSGSPRELRICDHFSIIDALAAAHNWPDGTVLATSLGDGGPVVEITENPDRSVLETPRELRCVGELRHGINFHPADGLEPAVTDAMVGAALDALGEAVPDGVPVGWLMRNIRPAIAAALTAQKDGS